jgi:hypothetical protein
MELDSHEDCKLYRPRQTELSAGQKPNEVTDAIFVHWCPTSITFTNVHGKKTFENRQLSLRSGRLVKAFSNLDQSATILMFEDLSVHFIKNNKHIWSLDQSIS